MKRSEVYETITDSDLKEALVKCEVAKVLPVEINYELYKLVNDHVAKNYKIRRTFVEKAIINQLIADGVIK